MPSSTVSLCVWQPGNVGQNTWYPPSSSFSKITVNRCVVLCCCSTGMTRLSSADVALEASRQIPTQAKAAWGGHPATPDRLLLAGSVGTMTTDNRQLATGNWLLATGYWLLLFHPTCLPLFC